MHDNWKKDVENIKKYAMQNARYVKAIKVNDELMEYLWEKITQPTVFWYKEAKSQGHFDPKF